VREDKSMEIFGLKPEGKRQSDTFRYRRRIILKWRVEGVDWFNLIQNRYR
jgi:hypothetical protein